MSTPHPPSDRPDASDDERPATEPAEDGRAATDEPGATPDEADATPDAPDAGPDEQNATPDEQNATPDESGATPDAPDATPDEAGTSPDEPASSPDERGAVSDESGSTPGAPDAPGATPRRVSHAAPRPYPPAATGPAAPASAPSGEASQGMTSEGTTSPGTAPEGTTSPGTASADEAPGDEPTVGTPVHGAVPATPPATSRRARRATEPDEHDLPEPPSRPGVGRHLLGVLVGLALTPVAVLAWALPATGGLGWPDGTTGDPLLGWVVMVVGLALLALVVLLGRWSPAVPITGGAVWGVGLGLAYLIVPGPIDDAAGQLGGVRAVEDAVDILTGAARGGLLLTLGVLLLSAGIATGWARRAGRRWAQAVDAVELERLERRAAGRPSGEDARTS
jgi:hypothetical protein